MIFLLYGPDTFRSRAKLNLLKEKFLSANQTGTVITQAGSDLSPASFVELTSPSLFGGKRFIIIENFITQGQSSYQPGIVAQLDNLSDDTFLIFWEDGEIDAKSPLVTQLNTPGQAEYFKAQTPVEAVRLITSLASSRGVTIAADAARYLATVCANDAWQISTEFAKLSVANPGHPITIGLIDELVAKPLSVKAFDLLDAIAGHDQATTNRLVITLARAGEDPIRLLGMVAYHLRAQIRVFDAVAAGKNRAEIIKITKLHPFAVGKAMQQATRVSRDWLVAAYQATAQADWMIKSGERDGTDEVASLAVRLAGHA